MYKYDAYRISLLAPVQPDIFEPNEPITKKELFDLFVKEISSKKKLEFVHGDKRHVIYFLKKIDANIYMLQLAREDNVTQPQEGPDMIEDKHLTILPNVHFFLDLSTQIILIQHKTVVFKNSEASARRLVTFFEKFFITRRLTVKMEAIVLAEDFWKQIYEATNIYELELDLLPPNFFKSRFKTNVDVKEAHEETNFTNFKIILKNKLGGLRVKKEEFGDVINALASGAGSYIVVLKNKIGNKIRIRNYNQTKSIHIDEPENANSDFLRAEMDKLDQLNEAIPSKKKKPKRRKK